MITPAGNLDPDVWRRLATGEPLALPDLGLGVLHHVHADDVAQAFERALTRPAAIGSSFHVVAEQAMTLRGLATGVAAWFGREPELEFVDWPEFERRVGAEHAGATREHVGRSIAASIDRARDVLGYAPALHLAGRAARGAAVAGRERPRRRRRRGVLGLSRQPERASLGVLADRPGFPRVDDAPTERFDPLQRRRDIGHREVRQREGIARSTSAGMDADRGGFGARLPALPLAGAASLQLHAEELRPEAPGALGIVSGKLDQITVRGQAPS